MEDIEYPEEIYLEEPEDEYPEPKKKKKKYPYPEAKLSDLINELSEEVENLGKVESLWLHRKILELLKIIKKKPKYPYKDKEGKALEQMSEMEMGNFMSDIFRNAFRSGNEISEW